MVDLVKILREHLDSLTPEQKEAEWESITHEKFWSRWTEKFHNLGKEKRDEFIEKAIKKYECDEYIDKEYRLGYEPRKPLYNLFLQYGIRYGEADDTFGTTCGAYRFDDWIVCLYIGQGSYITLKKNWRNEKNV